MSRWKVPEHFKVRIGGNTYIDCPTIIDYKGQSLFELRRNDTDGFLGINFDLYAKNGSKIATVRNGQFVGSQPIRYSIEGSPGRYKLVEGATGKGDRVRRFNLREDSFVGKDRGQPVAELCVPVPNSDIFWVGSRVASRSSVAATQVAPAWTTRRVASDGADVTEPPFL